MSKVFNWHEEDRDSFLSWMYINLVVGEDFDEIGELTDKSQNVDLTILINGKEMDVDYFVSSIERNMIHLAELRAMEILRENARLTAIEDMVGSLTSAIRQSINDATRGTELADWNDRW